MVRAGGRAVTAMRLTIARPVSQSQLARLWESPVFGAAKPRWLMSIAARFGAWFTVGAVGLAAAGAVAWWPDAAASASVATAVLIVACPCALTLAAPIALGTAMGQLGMRGLFVRQPAVVLDLSRVDTVVFDKTGTLTGGDTRLVAETSGLSPWGWSLVRRLAQESTHPTSSAIAASVPDAASPAPRTAHSRPRHVREVAGEGISGVIDGQAVAIGSASFIARCLGRPIAADGKTHVVAGAERGWLRTVSAPRAGMTETARTIGQTRDTWLLSGDHDGERAQWSAVFGPRMRFEQSPDDKLSFVTAARSTGRRVLMCGDGLNDAGALAAADVGIAVSDDTACLVPACDAFVRGDRLTALPAFLTFARQARRVVFLAFAVSVVYNALGLWLALTGALTPLVSAILMPVSSVTVIALSAGLVRWHARALPS
jgi:Cu+-exporting ATPase